MHIPVVDVLGGERLANPPRFQIPFPNQRKLSNPRIDSPLFVLPPLPCRQLALLGLRTVKLLCLPHEPLQQCRSIEPFHRNDAQERPRPLDARAFEKDAWREACASRTLMELHLTAVVALRAPCANFDHHWLPDRLPALEVHMKDPVELKHLCKLARSNLANTELQRWLCAHERLANAQGRRRSCWEGSFNLEWRDHADGCRAGLQGFLSYFSKAGLVDLHKLNELLGLYARGSLCVLYIMTL
mmetsp:Transcript_14253/g.23737  ORF Transcript_14253/g.23737 Transcript_14253/m.23737 type:complete len:243 (+) Transcript_14253:624-1352(+)